MFECNSSTDSHENRDNNKTTYTQHVPPEGTTSSQGSGKGDPPVQGSHKVSNLEETGFRIVLLSEGGNAIGRDPDRFLSPGCCYRRGSKESSDMQIKIFIVAYVQRFTKQCMITCVRIHLRMYVCMGLGLHIVCVCLLVDLFVCGFCARYVSIHVCMHIIIGTRTRTHEVTCRPKTAERHHSASGIHS